MFPRHLAPDPTRRLARGLVAGLVAGLLIGAGAPAPRAAAADADDVEASLNAALEAYRAGDIALAREETAFAATLLDQLKADDLGAFLPEPLPGWTREEGGDAGMASAMFGGGLVSQAVYVRDGESIEITLAADGPMVTAMSAMFSNAMALSAMGKVSRIGQHKAVTDEDGEMRALIARRVLVSVSGDAGPETKAAYFEAIDLDALAEF
ncbi:MAG: hypothetical protein CML43_13795 [Rhodobacteraceae bacterium]|nr:hypothetical protein [Paracoccaceae bacterium]